MINVQSYPLFSTRLGIEIIIAQSYPLSFIGVGIEVIIS